MNTHHDQRSSGRRRAHLLGLLLTPLALLAVGCEPAANGPGEAGAPAATEAASTDFEVWIVDQADSNHEEGYGGWMYVFRGDDVMGDDPGAAEALHRLDLGAGTAELCREETGVNPVRPHMLLFNQEGTHAILSFVGSGHVVIYDAATREALDCIRTSPGAGGAQQAHAAFPAPDGSYIVVANQNGKLLERIDTDFRAGTFVHNTNATLDLANGTTPADLPREDADLRPDNAPICPVIDESSRYTWVTLRGGGLFVVDSRAEPMRIVAEYDRDHVKGNGCGGVQAGGGMFINSGGAPVNLGGEEHPHLHLHGFDVYRFPLDGYEEGAEANTPEAELVFTVGGERDSHGMTKVRDGRHVWIMDRNQDVAEVLEVATGDHVNTVQLVGEHTDNPAPDLVDISPGGERIFAAFRGSVPLTGDPHNATGSTPGLGIVHVDEDGRSGAVIGIVHFTNDRDGVNIADPHAVRVRHLD
jgi:hypothetical protein